MASIDLTDEEAVNLKWLLDAIGCPSGNTGVRILQFANTGKWSTSLWKKLSVVVATIKTVPARSLDQLRADLGAYAASATTQQTCDDLRAVLDDANAIIAAASSTLTKMGIADDSPLAMRIARLGKV